MTIVHENECIKNKQFITNNDHVLIDNFEENIEITKLKTDEEDVSKCKFNLTCFCHMSDNNKFFSLFVPSIFYSFYNKHDPRVPHMPSLFLMIVT